MRRPRYRQRRLGFFEGQLQAPITATASGSSSATRMRTGRMIHPTCLPCLARREIRAASRRWCVVFRVEEVTVLTLRCSRLSKASSVEATYAAIGRPAPRLRRNGVNPEIKRPSCSPQIRFPLGDWRSSTISRVSARNFGIALRKSPLSSPVFDGIICVFVSATSVSRRPLPQTAPRVRSHRPSGESAARVPCRRVVLHGRWHRGVPGSSTEMG